MQSLALTGLECEQQYPKMGFPKVGLLVALYQAVLENLGQRLIVGIQGVSVQSLASTGLESEQ